MSEVDLSASLNAARDAVAKAAVEYTAAQDVLAEASDKLAKAQARLARLERALAILNGEEPASAPTAAPAAPADPAPPAAPAPAASPPPQPYQPPASPFAHLECSACGEVGTYRETYRTTKGGVARLLVCSDCENEQFLG